MPNMTQGPMDVGAGMSTPQGGGCDQSEYPGVPGHNSPMHPGFDADARQFTSRTASKHKSYKRERAPSYDGGRGGNDGSM